MKTTLSFLSLAMILSTSASTPAVAQTYTPPAPKPVLSCDGLSMSSLYDGGFMLTVSDSADVAAITKTITSMSSYMQQASQLYTRVTLNPKSESVSIYLNSGSGGITGAYYVSPGASEANFMQKTALYGMQKDGTAGMSLRISTSTNAGTRDSDVNWQPLMGEMFFKNCQNANTSPAQ